MAGRKRSSFSFEDPSPETSTASTLQGAPDRAPRGNAAMQDALRAHPVEPSPDLDSTVSSFGALLGADLGGFAVGTGGQAEGLDAAGVCDGSGIDLHPAVLGSGADLRSLLAHESVHAAQSQRSGSPAPVAALEAEADAGAEALMAGRPFEVQHTAAVGTPLQESLSAWLGRQFSPVTETVDAAKEKVGIIDWEKAAEDTKASDGDSPVKEEDGVKYTAETYLGTDTPVRAEDHDYADAKTWRSEGRTVEEKKGVKTIRLQNTTKDEQGRESRSIKERVFEGDKVTKLQNRDEELDVAATARDTRQALEKAKAPHQVAREKLIGDGQRLEKRIGQEDDLIRQEAEAIRRLHESVGPDGDAEKDPEVAPKLAEARRRLRAASKRKDGLVVERDAVDTSLRDTNSKLEAIAKDQALLAADPTQMEAIASRNGLKVEKRMKVVDRTKSDSGWGRKEGDHFAAERVQKDEHTKEVGDATHVKSKGTTDTVSLKEMKASRERDLGSTKTTVKRRDFAGEDVTSDRKTATTSVSLKDGLEAGQVRKRESKGPDGSENIRSNGGSAHFKDGKLGATGTHNTRVKDANGRVRERDASVTLDTDGAKGTASRTDGIEKEHGEAKVTTSANGNFTVTAVPVKGPPPGVRLTTTISGGAALKGSAKAKKNGREDREGAWKDGDGKASVGGHVGGGVSATYTHTRTLSVEEAKAYLASVDTIDKGGAPSGKAPELNTWAKLKAIGDNGGVEKLAAAVGSSESAGAMRDGDTVSMELSGHIEGGVDGSLDSSGTSLGVGVSGKASRTRKVTVARGKDNVVKVTVNFASASEATGKVTAGHGVSKGGVSDTSGSSSGRGVTFTLRTDDPAYDQKYGRIVGTLTEAGLESLRKELANDVSGRSFEQGKKKSRKGNAEVKGVSFNVGEFNETNERFELEGNRASGEFTGKGGQSADLTVGGVKVLGSSDEASVSANVTADGDVTVDLQESHTDHSLGVPDELALPTDLEGAKDQAALLANLKEKVQKAETSLRGYRLSGRALDGLVGRAGDHGNWVRCAALHPRSIGSWMTLRGALLSPHIDPEWAAVDPEQAARLARARALARFAGATGTDGAQVLENALRHWGQDTFGGGEEGAALGLGYEWPAAIASHKPTFEAAIDGVKALPAKFDGWLAAENGLKQELEVVNALGDDLNTVQMAIVGCDAFEEPQMRAELLRRLSADRTALRAHHTTFMQRLQAQNGGTPVDEDALMAGDAERRVRELGQILDALKGDEKRLLKRVDDEMDDLLLVDTQAVHAWLDEVTRSWDEWEQVLNELRTTREATGMGPDPKQAKRLPDTARVIRCKKELSGFARMSEDEVKALPDDSMTGMERDRYIARERWTRDLAAGK